MKLQVRYHPAPADDGDIAGWLRFVRRVVREFGPMRRVTGLQITNEVDTSTDRIQLRLALRRRRRCPLLGCARPPRRPAAAQAHRLGGSRPLPRDLFAGRALPGADRGLRRRFLEGIAHPASATCARAGSAAGSRCASRRRLRDRTRAIRGRSGHGDRRVRPQAHRYPGTYNITDFCFFGLRDNNSAGPGFQQHLGLLRDDYTEEPAFGVYRRTFARYGAH